MSIYPKRSHYWSAIALSTVILYPFLRRFIQPIYFKNNKGENKGRTVIITGATGNLGFAMSMYFAKRKYRVIMACRDMDLCKVRRREIVLRTGYKEVACRHLELEDLDSVNKFVANINKTEPRIDVLVNNAAVKHEPNKTITKLGIERTYMVNYVAPFILSMLLLDKLIETSRKTQDARIINVIGSPRKSWLKALDLNDINFEERPYAAKEAYRQSKLALAYFTILLDKYCADKGEHVYVYGWNPIFKLWHDSLPRHVFGAFETACSMVKMWTHAEPELATQSVIALADDDEYKNRSESGELYSWGMYSFGWGVARKDDELAAKKVWNHTLEMLSKK